MSHLKKFEFDDEDMAEILSQAPELIMDRPGPEIKPMESLRVFPSPTMALDSPPRSECRWRECWQCKCRWRRGDFPPLPQGEVKVETAPGLSGSPSLVFPRKARDFWQEKLASSAGGSPSNENFPLASNFSSVEKSKIPTCLTLMTSLLRSPPKTLREARLSPWWPQYEAACKVDYDGHIQNGTWDLVPLSDVPPGKNILRGKWVFDDKRGEDGRILKFKARFVAMGFTHPRNFRWRGGWQVVPDYVGYAQ